MSPPISRRSLLRSTGVASGMGVLGGNALASRNDDRDRSEFVVGTSSQAAVRAAESRASSVSRVLDFEGIGQAVAGRFPQEAIEALRERADVRYVEPDAPVPPLGQDLPWGIDRIDADEAHAADETGNGAHVAIIDSGIDATHEDLEANLGEGYAVVSCSSCEESWGDDDGHGTHCAGIAAAVDNDAGVVGVSSEATLHAVKVYDADNYATVSGLSEGIQWVADQGYDVGSMSLGATSSYSTLRDACQYAYEKGVLLVASAGNDGCSDCVRYPAAYSTVVAVSATTSSDSLASYSSTGPEIELAAPGSSIYSTVPGGYSYKSGTSMACPHVAGAGGQVMANGYSNTEARERLRETAEDIGLSESQQGYGLVDVEAAVADSSSGSDDDADDGADDDATLEVSTDGVSAVEETSATLEGSLEDRGGADAVDVYFEYRIAGDDAWSTTDPESYSSTGSFSHPISDLEGATDYAFRAVASTDDGTDTGGTLEFTTDAAEVNVAVSTEGASNVAETSATLEGTLEELSGVDSADVYFEWGERDDGLPESTTPETLTATGPFEEVLEGLSGGTDYEFRAVATVGDDVVTGETLTVTTDSEDDSGDDSGSGSVDPAIDDYAVSEAGSPNPHAEITARWAVSDDDGDLESVLVEVLGEGGSVEDSAETAVSGSSDSGEDEFKIKHVRGERFEVRLTVEDSAGNDVSDSDSVTA